MGSGTETLKDNGVTRNLRLEDWEGLEVVVVVVGIAGLILWN